MPETFDPRTCGGGPACVQMLRGEYEIRVSQRLGARLVAFGRRGVQFSLALLEAASPGSDFEKLLLDERWSACSTASEAAALIDDWGRVVVEDDLIKLVARDEVEHGDVAPDGLAQSTPRGELATRTARGTAWDADQLREVASSFLDAEDATELVEKLRMLFRAALAARLDPVPLLVKALQRNKNVLTAEVGALVRQHLDRDTGRAVEDLAQDDDARTRDALHFLMRTPENGTLAPLVLPAVTPVMRSTRALRHTLLLLPGAIPLVGDDPDIVEPFLDAILDQITELEAPERFAISRFLVRLQHRLPAVSAFLFRRLHATVDSQVQAYYGNVLARMHLGQEESGRVAEALVDLFRRHGNDVALAERLKVTFLHLGALPLAQLTENAVGLSELQRSYVVDLWISYLHKAGPHPPLQVLAQYLAGEIAARNRAALLCMIRSSTVTAGQVELMQLPALIEHVRENDGLRGRVIAILLEEAVHLEDPDDLAVMGFLARLGREAVQCAFDRTREEAALDSRAAPYRFRVFAYIAAQMEPAPWLSEMTEIALGWPFLRRLDLPVTLTGLGLFSRIPGVGEEALLEILSRVLPEDPSQDVKFAPTRMQAALAMHAAPTCPETVRRRIEARLEQLVSAEAPSRAMLVAALDGLEAIIDGDVPPLRIESIAVTLARMVLRKSRESSLDHVLADMLRDETEGHGVRVPEAWSKEERDRALVILGKAACHPRVPDPLHRMITARLAGFLEDWLDAHERGENLYLHRDTPLWRVMVQIVEVRPSDHAVEAVTHVGLRALEVHALAPAHLALDRREDVQRLLAHLIWLAPQEEVEVRGSLVLDIPKTALQTLMNLATRDNETAQRVLEESVDRVPQRLRPQIDAFLSFQRRRTQT